MNSSAKPKRGYLNQDFKLFHIYDKRAMDFDSHSHDFHKIIICLSGSVTYIIEGKTYILSPWNILLVPKDMIHHSKTDSSLAYERIVLFIDSEYLDTRDDSYTLSNCFRKSAEYGKCLFHADGAARSDISSAADELEKALSFSENYGSLLLQQAAFIRLLVYINRLAANDDGLEGFVSDKRLENIISYINEHFADELSVGALAQKFYMSRSYLMHKFKAVTGGSVYGYINQKRLTSALAMLRKGASASDAAKECGFSDYTVFYRSFKKMYGFSPGEVISGKQ